MGLSKELIQQFVKATNDLQEQNSETFVLGTAVISDGKTYVKIDGSESLTPIKTTTKVNQGDRVTVMIKNHTATITGNITSPSVDKNVVENKIDEFGTIIANDIIAQNGKIDNLIAENVTIKGDLTAVNAEIENLTAENVNINGKLTANEAEIEDLKVKKLDVETAKIEFATIENLNATNAEVNTIKGNFADFSQLTAEDLTAINANIKNLQAEKLNAKEAEIKYANIDFANIGMAAIEKLFADSGIIKDLVVNDQHITGELVGVTIKGDLIEGNTIVADKLVVKGSDGLYYKLNTDGMKVEAEQTEYNSLNGSIITAKSITASKVMVDDLVAFDATIGGFKITNSSIYSGVKESATNTTRGIYLDKTGQVSFGDANNFLKFFKDTDGVWKLAISANSIKLSASSADLETALDDINNKVQNTTKSIEERFAISNSSTTAPTSGWSTTPPTWQNGKYIWSKTITTYTDGRISESKPVCITGAKGETGASGSSGKGIKSVTNYYLATTLSTGVTESTFGWTTTAQTMTTTKKYLWNYEVITYTDSSTTKTTPVIIGVYGDKGATGSTGATGATGNGIKSIQEKYAVSTSNKTAPTTWYDAVQVMTSTNKYLWNYEIITYTNGGTSETSKRVIGVYGDKGDKGDKGDRGLQGLQGPKGDQGIPGTNGTNGTNGKTSYFHIKYSSVAKPTSSSQMTETPNTYIGTYVDYNAADSTDPNKYTWSRFEGLQGPKGDQGIPGTNGANGKTSYLHIKYSNDGGKTFTTNNGEEPGDWIGQYTDFNVNDSTSVTAYKWSLIKGEAGVGITSVDVEYYLSTSATSLSGGSWSTTAPSWVNGKYMWSRTKTVTTAGETTYSSPVCITGGKGSTGSSGNSFLVFTTNYRYNQSDIDAYSKSGYTGTWQVNEGTTGCKKGDTVYLRVYNTSKSCNSFIIAKVNTVTTTSLYTTSFGISENGATGQGISSITEEYYLSTSKTTQTGGSWVTTPPTWSTGKYMWTRSKIVYKNPTATAYTTPICDSSWEAVNEVKVGGTNMALDTNKGVTGWGWSMAIGGKTISEVTENGIRCCKMVRDSVASTSWSYIHYSRSRISREKYLPNKQYTVSFEVKASVATKFTVVIKNGGGLYPLTNEINTETTVVNTWTKLSATLTTLSTLPTDTSQVLYFYGMNSNTGVSYIFRNLKIEEGNKATAWTPAPDDIEKRVADAEQKIEPGRITATVEEQIKKNGSTVIATTSYVIQEADKVIYKFASTAGQNRVKNGAFQNGTRHWSKWNTAVSVTVGTSTLGYKNSVAIETNGANQGLQQTVSNLKVGQTYTLSAYVSISSGSCQVQVNNNGTYPGAISSGTGDQWLTVTFTAKATSVTVFIGRGSGGSNGKYYFTAVQLQDGEIKTAWVPHPSEIYDGSTMIDSSGVTINNGALTVKNKAGQTVLSGDSDGNLSLTGSLVVSSNKNQILRVDTADTKYPHMVIDSYGPYMDRLSVCSDYAGYAQQKAVDGVFIRNDSMTIHGTGERLFIQGDLRANGKVTSGSGFVSNKFTMGSLTDVINNAPWYGIGTSDIVWNGGNAVQLAGYWGLRLRTANTYLNMYNSVGSRLLYNNGTGTLEMGAMNTSYMHFGTDRPAFYFHQTAETAGDFKTNDTTSVSGFLGYRGGGYYRISPSSGKGSVCFEQYYPGSSTSSGLKLHIDSWYLRPNGNDGGILGTSSVRWQQAHITNGVTTGSDSKLKENIQVIPREVTISSEENNVTALDFYNYLRGSRAYTFNYKGIERTQLGILADDIPETVFNAIGLMSKTEEEYQQELETKQRCITLLEELPSLLDNEENLDKIINEEENLTLKEVREIAESEVQEPVRLINSQSHTALLQEVLSLLISKVETLEYQSQELIKRIKELENIKYKSLGN